jgi:hypothetical protein
MQLPEKYKENFDSEVCSNFLSIFSLYFSGSCIPANESLCILPDTDRWILL